AVELGLLRLRVRDRAQDGQPGGRQQRLLAVLPVPVPHVVVRAPVATHRLARHRRRMESRHLSPAGSPIPQHAGLAVGRPRPGGARHWVGGTAQYVAVLRRPPRPAQATLTKAAPFASERKLAGSSSPWTTVSCCTARVRTM